MVNGQKYYYMTEVGAEILMFITCLVIAFCALWLNLQSVIGSIGDKFASLSLSSSYALFLPLMSYMYSQAQQYKLEVRAQTILFWMVIIEIIRILGDSTWELRKSLEQLVRLFWVGYLICSYPHLQGIRLSLLILCIGSTVYEILKGIRFNKAKDKAAPAAQAAQAGPSNQQLMDYMVELNTTWTNTFSQFTAQLTNLNLRMNDFEKPLYQAEEDALMARLCAYWAARAWGFE